MPLVDAPKVDPDEVQNSSYRPERKDLDGDDIKRQLERIEASRESSRAKNKSKRPTPQPTEEEGFYPAQWDRRELFWREKSKADPTQWRIWDEREGKWKPVGKAISSGSNIGLLSNQDRSDSTFHKIFKQTASWFQGKGKS